MRQLSALCCFLLVSAAALAAVDTARLDAAIAASGLPRSSLSLFAAPSGDGHQPLISLNAHQSLMPASVTKLVTAAAVLKQIPLNTRFETRLESSATVVNGVLTGDLVLRGGGDPSFVSETLWLLVNRLAGMGVTGIAGDILVDDGYFDTVLIDPSRDTERSEMAYDAPVSATSFNWNAVALTIKAGGEAGAPARVSVEPNSDYVQVDNRVRTVPGHSLSHLKLTRKSLPGKGDLIAASGTIGVDAPPYESYRNITQPALWVGHNLALYLRYRGIRFNGEIRPGNVPPDTDLLASVDGRPVEQLVKDMNKVSSNFIAEMLTKQLAARTDVPGTMADGMAIIHDYLRALGVNASEFRLTNPSGLTQQNRLSAHALVKVLEDMAHDFRLNHEYLSSLPIAGVDGTLEKRMTASPARGWVRAKTGYIDGVVSLAGYAGQRHGDPIAFAFIYNGTAPAHQVRRLFDQLGTLLVAAN